MMKGLLSKYKKLDRTKEAEGAEEKASKRARVEEELHSKVDVKFLIIGAQKAGTTALATNLSKHPDVNVKNECQFFTFCWGFGSAWYRDQLRSGSGGKSILGEKTPEIIYCDDCAPRVKQVCPDAKFIFCIRDPINRSFFPSTIHTNRFTVCLCLRCNLWTVLLTCPPFAPPRHRAYSSWNMEVRTDKEQLPFEESLERELGSMGSMRTYGTAEYHYVQRGFYMDQIERFQKTFPDP